MRRSFAAAAVALCALASVMPVPAGAEPTPAPAVPPPASSASPGLTYTYRSEAVAVPAPDSAQTRTEHGGVLPEAHASAPTAPAHGTFAPPANSDFVFQFTGVDQSQRAVFAAAAGIWSEVLEVEVPIDVRVTTMSFPDPGILGGAEPTEIHANDITFPETDVWYVSAQANQFASRDLDPSEPEIDIVISSDFDFYEGIDDRVPVDQTSLLNLALHELGHGLGHITLARSLGSSWAITWPTPNGRNIPLAYDRLLQDASGTPLIQLPSAALGTALTTRVLWNGPEAVAVDGGLLPEIYAPAVFQAGSSTSHLDESWYPDELMTPSIADGEARLDIPPLTQAMFADFGWGLEVSGPDESFVTALSRDFLSSFPTPSELRESVGALRQGTPRRALVARYANSDEYLSRLVDGFYLSTLGRPADPAGKQYWLRRLRDGRTPASVAAGFYASGEYFRLAGNSNRAWITDLYVEILGRQPDPNGLRHWLRSADPGPGRTDISFAFYQSVESRTKRVTDLYHHLLGRAPDPGGLVHWRAVLDNGRDVHLAVELARSPEYQARALRRYG